MKTVIFLALLLGTITTSSAAVSCPICGRQTVDVTTQQDDLSKPSVNLCVWNRSMCANEFYGKGSLICPHDHYAYEAQLKTWNKSVQDRDAFPLPLHPSIYSFPLPPTPQILSRVVYSQTFASLSSVEHSVLFWCKTDDAFFKQLEEYSKAQRV